MTEYPQSPLFPRQALSPETLIKLPPKPSAQSASVKMYVILAEPTLFVQGFDENDLKQRPPVLLRGCLFVRILKPVKIKSISLKFTGISKTDWPEGIPPKKSETTEVNVLMQHNWPFFNWNQAYPVTETSRNNADIYLPLKDEESNSDVANLSLDATISPVTSAQEGLAPTASSMLASLRRAASPSPIRSTTNIFKQLTDSNDLTSVRSSDESSALKTFVPGDYIYNFEHPIPASMPESMNLTFGSVVYTLEASLERSGTFKSSLLAHQEVTIVRTPAEESSEESEPISISKEWDDQLAYDIIISSKMVVLNTFLPLAFKLTPLAKIKVHRLRVYLTEHMEYYCRNKGVHRMEPVKKYLLLEHKPPEGVDSLLAADNDEITGREFEFQVYVPESLNDKHKLHPDTSSSDIQSHHWIKLCIRVSKANPTAADPKKRKHFEISIDSPMHVLSSLAVHANTLLPAYTTGLEPPGPAHNYTDVPLSPGVVPIENSIDGIVSPDFHLDANLYKPKNIPMELRSPQAVPFSPDLSPEMLSPELRGRSNTTLSMVSKVSRPIQLIRRPSFDPPPFDADCAPPPFSDPPAYSSLRQESEGDLAKSFNFQGLSPNLPDAIARATSPIRSPPIRVTSPPPTETRRGSSFSSERSVPLSVASELSAFDPILAEPLLRNESYSRQSIYGSSRRGSLADPGFRDREQSFDITSLYAAQDAHVDTNIWQPMDFGMHPPRNTLRTTKMDPPLSSKPVFYKPNGSVLTELDPTSQETPTIPQDDSTSLTTSDERSFISKHSANSGSSVSTLQGSGYAKDR